MHVFVVQIYASPIYEFMDTHFEKKGGHEWSTQRVIVRLVTRTTYILLSTFLGALLPFFGDFVALTGALAAFPLESGLVHHMYIKVISALLPPILPYARFARICCYFHWWIR